MDGHECDGENLTKNGFTRDFTTFQHGGTLALSELEIDKSTAVPGIPPPSIRIKMIARIKQFASFRFLPAFEPTVSRQVVKPSN